MIEGGNMVVVEGRAIGPDILPHLDFLAPTGLGCGGKTVRRGGLSGGVREWTVGDGDKVVIGGRAVRPDRLPWVDDFASTGTGCGGEAVERGGLGGRFGSE